MKHRDRVDCLLSRGIVSPDTLAEDTGKPCDCEPDDTCPNDWRVRGYVRSSHSMFHPALHECGRKRGHAGRCRCWMCGATSEVKQ